MGIGIQICGLNGSGKSTLGKVLAERTGFYFIDNENLFFSESNAEYPYENPKNKQDVIKILSEQINRHPDFIFAAVKGDYGNEIMSRYNYIIVLEVPEKIRMQRVRNRSFQKFGNRMLANGDLYRQEETFFKMVESRQEDYIENWLHMVKCPVIRVDGMVAIEKNVDYIIQTIGIRNLHNGR